jgi:hypothetical protein
MPFPAIPASGNRQNIPHPAIKTAHRVPVIEQFPINAKRQPIDYQSLTKTAFF